MIRVRFWGTRGSIAAPGPTTRYYGGDTACVELIGFENSQPGAALQPNNPHLLLDAGTGLAALQHTLMGRTWGKGQGDLQFLLSHYHWDHLIGLPFFAPMFVKGNQITFYGDSLSDLQESIERLFTSVYSPLEGVQNVAAALHYRQTNPAGMEIAGFLVQTAENRHPGGALSFRIQYGPHVVVYSTDHEAGDPKVDSRLVEFARGAHLWILDAHFTAQERQYHHNWGHSSHLEAVELARQAGVEMVALFHHNPDHDDQILDRKAREAAEIAAGSQLQILMARDGMVVDIG